MAYTPHLKIKPKVIAEAAATALTEKLVISNTVNKTVDQKQYWLSEGDTVSVRVKGTLPVREYAMGNDRSEPIVTDTYSETSVSMTVDRKRPYSALKLTDEQKDMDFNGGWGDLIDIQSEAMGEYLENGVLNHIKGAPYERRVVIDDTPTAVKNAIAVNQDVFFNGVVDAKSSLRKMRAPGTTYTALCGLDFADQLVKSNKLIKNQGTGDSALADATLGTIGNVTFVASVHVDARKAYLYEASAFNVFNHVPSVPNSVPFGATATAGGFGVRWLMDYDTAFLTDRSVIDSWAAYGYTKDRIALVDQQGITHVDSSKDGEFFVRGVELTLKSLDSNAKEKAPGDGSTDTPGGSPDSWLAKAFKQQLTSTTIGKGEPFPLGGNYPMPAKDAVVPPAEG